MYIFLENFTHIHGDRNDFYIYYILFIDLSFLYVSTANIERPPARATPLKAGPTYPHSMPQGKFEKKKDNKYTVHCFSYPIIKLRYHPQTQYPGSRHTLEQPHRGDSNKHPQPMQKSRVRKKKKKKKEKVTLLKFTSFLYTK